MAPDSQSLAVLREWEWRRWTRETPGPFRWWLPLFVPVLFALPFEWMGLFSDPAEGVRVILGLAVVGLAVGAGHRTGRPTPEEFWLHQKGYSLADWALGRLVTRGGICLGLLLWWVVWAQVATHLHGGPVSLGLATSLAIGQSALFLLLMALLYFFGAAGTERTVESLLLVGLTYLVFLMAASRLPIWLAQGLGWALPPFPHAAGLGGGGEPFSRANLARAIRVGAYLIALLALATAFLARRRPQAE